MKDVQFLNYCGDICFYPRTFFGGEHSLTIEEFNSLRAGKNKSWYEYIEEISKTGNLELYDDQGAADVNCGEKYMTNVCYIHFEKKIPFNCFYKFERELLDGSNL